MKKLPALILAFALLALSAAAEVIYTSGDYEYRVLKDGTASIYGVQGQNGVILFRTKSAVEAEKAADEARKAERKAARAARRRK